MFKNCECAEEDLTQFFGTPVNINTDSNVLRDLFNKNIQKAFNEFIKFNYTNKNLYDAIKSGSEIMLKCSTYYAEEYED